MITEENRSKEIDVGKVNGVATKPPNWWVLGCIYIFLGCDSFCTYKWVERQVWWDSFVFFFLWWFFLLISACCFLMFFDDFDVRGRGITQFFNGKITILKTNAKNWWFGNVQSLELEEWCHFHIEIMSPMSLGSFCRFRCAKRRASEAKRRGAETQGLACSFLCSKSNRRWGYRYMPCIYDINNKSIYYMILYVCIYTYIYIYSDLIWYMRYTWYTHDNVDGGKPAPVGRLFIHVYPIIIPLNHYSPSVS